MGSLLTHIAGQLTPQNQFSANSPLNISALQTAVNQGQTGLQGAMTGESQLAQQLQNQAAGNGPNIAQMQLKQNTENAIKQNAGMVASQRGISPALAQRMAAQGAAQQTQAAAGQAAQLGAQQQLAAQQQLGGIYGQMGQQNLQNIQTSGGLANQAGLGVQGINAGTSAQNAAATQNAASGLLNGLGESLATSLSEGGVVKGPVPNPNVQGYDGGGFVQTGDTTDVTNDPTSPFNQQSDGFTPNTAAQNMDAALAAQSTAAGMAPVPGLDAPAVGAPGGTSTASPAKSNPFSAFSQPGGGKSASSKISDQMLAAAGIPIYAAGNDSMKNSTGIPKKVLSQGSQIISGGPMDASGTAGGDGSMLGALAMLASKGALVPHLSHILHAYHGSKVKAMVSPGEVYLNPREAKAVAMGNKDPLSGKRFQGKAQVKGDSAKNDTIKTELESGGVVIKRSKVKEGSEEARNFVAEKLHEGNHSADFHDALKAAIGARKHA